MITLRFIFGLCFFSILCVAYGQERRTGTIDYQKEGQGYRVRVNIPPPRTIPGARKAFDEHLIEFGDGSHSFEPNPVHQYKPGTHTIRTSIINNYDDGKPPKIPPRIIEINQPTTDAGNTRKSFLPDGESLFFTVFQDPMPEEEVVCILTYRNITQDPVSGKIDLYFNEYLYDAHFDFTEARVHHGETEVSEELLTDVIPDDIDESIASISEIPISPVQSASIDRAMMENTFESRKAWVFSGLEPGEERNVYISLQATEAMLKDTNATVALAATVETDDRRIQSMKFVHKQIVTSHDPNRMTVRPRRLYFSRKVRTPVEYFVKFQNHGEGPARQINVKCALSEKMDLNSLRVLEMYPPCPPCHVKDATYGCFDTTWHADGITFSFRNIYLPGREQDLTRSDSTKGFVRFTMAPGEKMRKVPVDARAEIFFDKNEPIRTNNAKMKFRTDLRTGLVGGMYDNRPVNADPSNLEFFAGTVIFPRSPYRFHYQAEIMPVYANYTIIDATSGTELYDLRHVRLDLVPLQVRKNLSSFAGLGAGVHVSTLIFAQQTVNGVAGEKDWLQDVRTTAFVDLNLGAVRSGLSAGARYYVSLDDTVDNFWSVYLMLRR